MQLKITKKEAEILLHILEDKIEESKNSPKRWHELCKKLDNFVYDEQYIKDCYLDLIEQNK